MSTIEKATPLYPAAPAVARNEAATRPGMGAILHPEGATFRVWAPHADGVAVVGSFNAWDPKRHPMASEGGGYWSLDISGVGAKDEYRFLLDTPAGELSRIDPYAREVTSSIGNSVVHDPRFDWEGDAFVMPPWNELVIYEMHVGTFHDKSPGDDAPADFSSIAGRFGHLKALGVNAIEVMPIAEFAGDRSWGYNPAHIFAVESAYGGPDAFKEFVKQAHRAGFAVILDVVYNHFGPSDLDLWRFDGWSENNLGGIYFYNDWRAETPWGHTRPDYGRPEVRQFIRDNALMWLDEFHVDGLRMDMTLYIRSVRSDGEPNLPDGWSLVQWINGEVREKHPGKITIAEDLQNNEWLTKGAGAGGAGFSSQWDARFVHPIRQAVATPDDGQRSMPAVADAIRSLYNGDAFQRVIYSESHDEVANGKARVPQEIAPDDAEGKFAQKRSTLAAGLVFTAPGIPMLFQGQEFLEGGWFRDDVPLDWDQRDEFRGIVRLYRDLIRLRLNRGGMTRGLLGHHVDVHHVNDGGKLIAFMRRDQGGPGDDVVVVANFLANPHANYRIGFPAPGPWRLLFNSDWSGYSRLFDGPPSGDVDAIPEPYDGQPASAEIGISAYSLLIYGRG